MRRVGGGHRPHGHPHQPTRVPAMRRLVERTKLLEPKIAPDAGRSGGSGGMCQGRSRLSTSTSPWQGTAPAGWDPAGAAIPVGSISGPRCSRLGLSLGPFRASVSPRSRWQARGPRGPFHHQLPLGYFRAGCSACAFFFFRTIASRRVTSGSGRWRRGHDSAVTAEGGQRWGRGQERCPSRSIQPPPHPALLSHLSLSALPGRATRKPNPLFSSAE